MPILTGRVVKRYPYRDAMAFIDVVGKADSRACMYTVMFLGQELVKNALASQIGDLVKVIGELDDRKKNDSRVCFTGNHIEVLTPWDKDTLGALVVDWNALRHLSFDDRPQFAMQCELKSVDRVLNILRESSIVQRARVSTTFLSASSHRTLLVWSNETFTKWAIDKPEITMCVKRIYALGESYALSADPIQAVDDCIARSDDSAEGMRLQMSPKQLSNAVLLHLRDKCDPKHFSHVLAVVFIDGMFTAALSSSQDAVTFDLHQTLFGNKDRVCRAESKLAELFRCRNWLTNDLQCAVDVGASPGGWSAYLAQSGVPRVVAVDKGNVVISSPSIEHWEMTGQDALRKLYDDQQLIDLYVCDANVPPSLTVEMLLYAHRVSRPHARFVVTLKNPYRRKRDWVEAKSNAITLISTICSDMLETHLVANTANETTVSGTFTS